MPAGFLRIPPNGPYAGNPPVVAGPNLASLIFAASGEGNRFEFAAADNIKGLFSAPGLGSFLPAYLKVGYQYNVVASFSVDQTGLTVSHLLQPKWNRRLAVNGAMEGIQTFGLGSMSSPNNHVNGTAMSEINTVVFTSPTFTPAVNYDGFELSLTCLSGTTAGLFLRNFEGFVQVWERGGVQP
jgi:hypothetical protein